MKTMRNLMLVGAVLLGMSLTLTAQDRIHLANGTVVDAKVLEIGSLEIKYKYFGEEEGPTYGVDKDQVKKIVFANGREESFGALPMDAEAFFAGQKRSALKINFMGPLLGHTSLFYEQVIKPGRTWQVRTSLVGLGRQWADNPRGFMASGGLRFVSKPSFYTANMRRSHLLQGWYANPEIFLGYTSFEREEYYFWPNPPKPEREGHLTGGLLLNLGKQWVLGERFVIDLGFGVGYGFGESRRAIVVGSNTGLAYTSYLNIGFTL
jgi:hypothetical protein